MSTILTESNLDKSLLYQDLPLSKQIDENGNLYVPVNSDALAQAIKVWLSSAKGEKIRSGTGGWLVSLLSKPMNQETADKIRSNIITGLANDFSPPITIVDLQVIPDVAKNNWIITVAGYNSSINVGVNTYAIVEGNGTGI